MLCGALPSRLKSCRACPALIVQDPEDSQTAREHNFPIPRVAEIAARAVPTQIELSVATLDVEHEYDHGGEEWKRETVLVQEDLTDSRVVGQEEDALHVSLRDHTGQISTSNFARMSYVWFEMPSSLALRFLNQESVT